MKLPFVILHRVTFEKLLAHDQKLQSDLDFKQEQLDDHIADLIQRREEVKNLRYNYERIKDDYKDLNHRFNKLLHNFNVLKKKTNASNKN